MYTFQSQNGLILIACWVSYINLPLSISIPKWSYFNITKAGDRYNITVFQSQNGLILIIPATPRLITRL